VAVTVLTDQVLDPQYLCLVDARYLPEDYLEGLAGYDAEAYGFAGESVMHVDGGETIL